MPLPCPSPRHPSHPSIPPIELIADAAWAQVLEVAQKELLQECDYEHEAAKAYGVAYESFLPDKNLTMGGVPKRSAFVIDGEGIVRYAEVNDNPGDLPNFDAIKETLQGL